MSWCSFDDWDYSSYLPRSACFYYSRCRVRVTKETTTSDLAGNANTALQRVAFLAYAWWCLPNLNLNLNDYTSKCPDHWCYTT